MLGARAQEVLQLYVARPSAITTEALRRIGELYGIEAEIRGKPPHERQLVRQQRAALY